MMHFDVFAIVWLGRCGGEEELDMAMPFESGHGEVAIDNAKSYKKLWCIFVRSLVVMTRVEIGYMLLWTELAPVRKEMNNAPLACG